MMRRYFLALAALGVFLAVAAGASQAGWGHHSESSQPGESMSSGSESTEGTTGAYEEPGEAGMESSGYKTEEAVETGRMPEEKGFESSEPASNEFGGTLFRQGIDDGP
ncbi:MAG: hypothetical protein HZB63_01875 [Deltaproteobacteria bacterium]|nr:hypothetical protein [Deltaproteobacteria bacterium]